MSNFWTRTKGFMVMPFMGMVLLASCGDDKSGQPQPLGAEVDFADHWADSVLQTLDQRAKAAQLILVAPPIHLDSAERLAFADSLAALRFGGLVLDLGPRDSLQALSQACHDRAKVPLWTALDAGNAWADAQRWPSLLSLGAVASDSLCQRWGMALAAESQFLGANICLTSAGKVAEQGTWTRDALSAAPPVVARLSDALLRGIAQGGVQACARPLRDLRDYLPADSLHKPLVFDEGLLELNVGAAMPLQRLLKQQPTLWLQATGAVYAAIDSMPIGHSRRALQYFLRDRLHFQGTVLSPRGGDVGHLMAGADLIVAPKDPLVTVTAIVAAVAAGRLSQEWLDSTVHRQLLAKARHGLAQRHAGPSYMLDPYPQLQQLDRAIGKATLVVLRDTKGRLPLGATITEQKIATVAYGLGQMSEMQIALEAYVAWDHFLIGAKSDSLALAAQLQRFKKYDMVVVGLHEALSRDSVSGRIPHRAVHFLKELDKVTRLVVVDFAGRRSLEDLQDLSCLAFVSEDRARPANLAGQAIMGAFPVTALLPDQISAAFPAGSGKVLPRKIRFEYTEPEDLGIDPMAMHRIDSVVETAIKRGVFPGCQVFAAKDGKVFLHKAYGYHDYSRDLRVRNDHLYDIASVSKIAATTLMAMEAYEADTLRLEQPLKYFMPDLDSAFVTIKDLTPRLLMTHTAGLPPGIVLNKYFKLIAAPDSIRNKIYSKTPDSLHTLRIAEDLYLASTYRDTVWNRVRRIGVGPTGSYEYSDLSMYLMKELLERIMGKAIAPYVDSVIYQPMGLRRICYSPRDRFEKEEIVPTAHDKHWRKQVLQGDVHDPTVAFLGGIGGPAGVFSNSHDLATIMQMLLNGGSYGGRQLFEPETVALFTSRQPGSHRGLGFDKQLSVPSCEKGYCCFSADPETFGHFGFTGTCAWADPRNQIVYVFLSNRVYPDESNTKINAYRVRQAVQQMIYEALGLGMGPS